MDKFPFPGSGAADSSSAPGLGIGTGNGAPVAPDAPAANPQPGTSPADAGKKFPFPGESGEPSAGAGAPVAPGPGGSSSSSSSSSSSDSSGDPFGGAAPGAPDLKDAGSEGTQARPSGHILHRAPAPAAKPQTADERESEDLRVANFYLDSGDLKGAYLRAQDAVKTAPDDPEAHFALAEMAAKLGKKDEAIAEYNACLKLDPPDKEKKDSNRALARLAK